MINKYTQLKIAVAVLDIKMKDVTEHLKITHQFLMDVGNGHRKSKRVSKYIDQKISEADKIIRQHKNKMGE